MENNTNVLLFLQVHFHTAPVNIYMFKVNSRNARKSCETCSKLTIKTEQCHFVPPENDKKTKVFRCFQGLLNDVIQIFFLVNFEDFSHLFLVFLLLSLNA